MTKQKNDTSEPLQIAFRKLPGFGEISEQAAEQIRKESSLFRFRIGQPIVDSSSLPVNAYWIIEGECRLFAEEENRLITVGRIGAGSSIGIPSLLRAEPCEKITASTPVVALGLPDHLIVKLYQSETSFKEWAETIWPAEIISILEQRQTTCKLKARTRSFPTSNQVSELITDSKHFMNLQ